MSKKTKALWLVIPIILLIVGLFILMYFVLINQSVVMPQVYKGFTQYEGTACGSYQCDYIYGKLLTSNIAEFDTGKSKWKVINFGGSWGSCGTHNGGYISGGCCTTTEVYKDGILVDTIRQGYTSESDPNPNTLYTSKVYCDDGTYDNCLNSSGIGVYPLRWGSTCCGNAPTCNNRQNDYTMILPQGTFKIDTIPSKTAYNLGDIILFTVRVEDNLFDTKGTLKIYYEAPSIFGTVTKTESKEIDLIKGENNYNFTLPISSPTTSVKITPELVVNYKTSNIKGVNYNFANGLKPIDSQEYFDLGTIKDNPIELNITTSSNINCNTFSCPEGYTCSKDGTCNKSNLMSYLLIGGIVFIVVIIMIIIYFAIKFKIKKK